MFGLDYACRRAVGRFSSTRAVERSLAVLSYRNHWHFLRNWSRMAVLQQVRWQSVTRRVESGVDGGFKGYYQTVQSMIHMANQDGSRKTMLRSLHRVERRKTAGRIWGWFLVFAPRCDSRSGLMQRLQLHTHVIDDDELSERRIENLLKGGSTYEDDERLRIQIHRRYHGGA